MKHAPIRPDLLKAISALRVAEPHGHPLLGAELAFNADVDRALTILRAAPTSAPVVTIHPYVGGSASVAVCPICDIAGCHHSRANLEAERDSVHHPRPDITQAVLEEWARNRADDAGAVARKAVALQFESQNSAAAWQSTLDAANNVIDGLRAENDRRGYVLEGVRGAIDTGRTEPLMVWRDQIDIALNARLEDRSDASGYL